MILVESDFMRALAEKLAARRETKADQVTSGAPKSYEAYREAVGYLEALKDVLADAQETVEELTAPRTPGSHFTQEG